MEICNMANPYALYTMNVDSSLGPTRYGDHDSEGNWYFDCSSFISYILVESGFGDGTNPWFTTFNMESYLVAWGWVEYDPDSEPWQNGDIMIRHGQHEHTEMVHDAAAYATMGAHSDQYAYAEQVSIRTFSSAGTWTTAYRWPGGMVPTPGVEWKPENFPNGWEHFTDWQWHTRPNGPGFEMDTPEAQDNARNVFTYCWQLGWTREAICALLGNMQGESGLNPGRHEVGGTGFGLVQWTPESVLDAVMTAVFGSYDLTMRNSGHHQMLCLFGEYLQYNYNTSQGSWEKDVGCEQQWYPSTGSAYGFSLEAVSWYDWAHTGGGKGALQDLTLKFMVDYLRPSYDASVNHWEQRVQFAQQWWDFFEGFVPPTPGPGPEPRKRRARPWLYSVWPLWMFTWPLIYKAKVGG